MLLISKICGKHSKVPINQLILVVEGSQQDHNFMFLLPCLNLGSRLALNVLIFL